MTNNGCVETCGGICLNINKPEYIFSEQTTSSDITNNLKYQITYTSVKDKNKNNKYCLPLTYSSYTDRYNIISGKLLCNQLFCMNNIMNT